MPLNVEEVLALVDAFDWQAYHESIEPVLQKSYTDILAIQGARGALRAGAATAFDVDDPFVQKQLTGYVGERILSLDETTKLDVATLVRNIIATEGGTAQQIGDLIADKVREKFADYTDWRADRIARSETSIAYNTGNLLGYRQAGVTKVRVIDSDDTDEACREANGQIWSLEKALANPIQHPGCRRDFEPILDDAA